MGEYVVLDDFSSTDSDSACNPNRCVVKANLNRQDTMIYRTYPNTKNNVFGSARGMIAKVFLKGYNRKFVY
jgi:hypothetical protein